MADFAFKGIKLTGEGEKYLSEMNKLKEATVHVGFQVGNDTYDDGADVAEIAAFNEFGTSSIPARPFMRQSWENHEAELTRVCQAAVNSITNGGTAEDACKTVGVAGVGIVQREIVEGDFVPNSPRTIARKGSAHPLIDTGQMRQSVHYVVKGK